MKTPEKPTRRCPIAASLRSPHLKPKVVKSKKVYTRKGRPEKGGPSYFLLDELFNCSMVVR